MEDGQLVPACSVRNATSCEFKVDKAVHEPGTSFEIVAKAFKDAAESAPASTTVNLGLCASYGVLCDILAAASFVLCAAAFFDLAQEFLSAGAEHCTGHRCPGQPFSVLALRKFGNSLQQKDSPRLRRLCQSICFLVQRTVGLC